MRFHAISLLLLLTLTSSLLGFHTCPVEPQQELVGKWTIDLTPEPGAEPYFTTMKITRVKGNRVFGTFYQTDIERGYINSSWGRTVVSFLTRDGSSTYYTNFTVKGEQLEGSTLALGRDFFSVWTGSKK